MIYPENTMRFKKPITTKEATNILGVDKRTIWKWGKQGKIKMVRDEFSGFRMFDAEELISFKNKLRKNPSNGESYLK